MGSTDPECRMKGEQKGSWFSTIEGERICGDTAGASMTLKPDVTLAVC